ncbi:hypothetical protein HT031_003616 [Scenedesmus sp. PABB004]|nr:hypothetical protein HT031_003616 [Scenedesmus sp. PABB004]
MALHAPTPELGTAQACRRSGPRAGRPAAGFGVQASAMFSSLQRHLPQPARLRVAAALSSASAGASGRALQRQRAAAAAAQAQQQQAAQGASPVTGSQDQQEVQEAQERQVIEQDYDLSYWCARRAAGRHYQPWWLQPPTIVATGLAFLGISLVLDDEPTAKTAVLAAGPVALYWAIFLLVLPRSFKRFAVDQLVAHPEIDAAAHAAAAAAAAEQAGQEQPPAAGEQEARRQPEPQ